MATRVGGRGMWELLDAAPTRHAFTSPMVFAGVCAVPFACAPVRVAKCLSMGAASTHMHIGKVRTPPVAEKTRRCVSGGLTSTGNRAAGAGVPRRV
eukprot:1114948-Prorocentrum_minimum.AAC.4